MEGHIESKEPTVRVKVLKGANNSLHELFNFESNKTQLPLNQRNLPKSFFVPPTEEFIEPKPFDKCDQSRYDNFSCSYIVSHAKTNSSPACLGTDIQNTQLQELIDHNRQNSLDLNQNISKIIKNNMVMDDHTNGYTANATLHSFKMGSSIPLKFAICELPSDYEMAINDKRQVYFLNHQSQDTTWFDPRLPIRFQKWGMTVDELEQLHIDFSRRDTKKSRKSNRTTEELAHIEASRMNVGDEQTPTSPGVDCSSLAMVGCQAMLGYGRSSLDPTAGSASSNMPMCSALRTSSVPGLHYPASHATGPMQYSLLSQRVPDQSVVPPRQSQHPPYYLIPPQYKQPDLPSHPIHSKSASQPVPMPVDVIGEQLSLCMGDQSALSAHRSNLAHLGDSSSSSSMLGLEESYPRAHTNTVTGGSSGHLIQGLEGLSITTNHPAEPRANSPSSRFGRMSTAGSQSTDQLPMHLPRHQLQYTCGGDIPPIPLIYNHAAPTHVHLHCGNKSSLHSQQNNIDSGMGQSLTGLSNPTANQTQKRGSFPYFDPTLERCDYTSELMEGLSYSDNWQSLYMNDVTPRTIIANMDISKVQNR